MVISTDNLFSLKVIGKDNQEIAINTFYDKLEDLVGSDANPLILTENRDFEVKFSCNTNDARLEMDGFDGINNSIVIHGEERYLEPRDAFVKVFAYDNFPLPPGRYILTVTCNGKCYYKSFLVVTNALQEFETNRDNDSEESINRLWCKMWEEVLQTLPNSAAEYGFINKRASSLAQGDASFNLFWKIGVIEKCAKQVVTALMDITNNPHAIVKKRYAYETKEEVAKRDFKAIKLNRKHKVNNKQVVPISELSYDLIENKYLKYMVKHLIALLDTFRQETASRLEELEAELEELEYFLLHARNNIEKGKYQEKLNYRSKVKAMLGQKVAQAEELKDNIGRIMQAEWFKALKEATGDNVSSQSFKDPRYHAVYTLYERLKSISAFYSNNKKLALVCKHSSLLYEYWNIINLVKLLVAENYTLLEADHARQEGTEIKFASLKSGDSFIFYNPEAQLKIKLYYEPTIPKLKIQGKKYHDDRELFTEEGIKAETNHRSKPLYTEGFHNTPDCVMNFYLTGPRNEDESLKDTEADMERFAGSLVIDFKYRNKTSFWVKDNKCRNQLNSYKSQFRTLYGDGEDLPAAFGEPIGLNVTPVKEIWALYPNMGKFDAKFKEPSEDLYLISVVPGEASKLEEAFRWTVEKILK